MNLSLLQRPKKVKADNKHLYIYAPCVLSEGGKLKAESVIKILEVHEGPTPEETTLKVIEGDVWTKHTARWHYRRDDEELCTKEKEKHGAYKDGGKRPKCGCEKPLAEMPEELQKAIHYVLLSDIGK